MKNSLLRTTFLVFVTFIVLTGNVSAKTDITDQVSIDRIPYNNSTYITSVKVYQDGDNVIVRGQLKRNRNSVRKFDGHIDIAIISPDGDTINSTSVNYTPRHSSTRTKRKAYRKTRFKASFSGKLQKGSTVRVSLHKKDYTKIAKGFNCGNNLAISE